jgi:hypothetical protein
MFRHGKNPCKRRLLKNLPALVNRYLGANDEDRGRGFRVMVSGFPNMRLNCSARFFEESGSGS